MSRVGIYNNHFTKKVILYNINGIDDLLVDRYVFDREKYLKTPDFEKIFNLDKSTSLLLAKHLIIDFFQLIKKDILNCDQFNFPFSQPYYMNLFIKDIPIKNVKNYIYDPRIDGKVFFPVLNIENKWLLTRKTGKVFYFKPDFRLLYELKQNVYSGIKYLSEPIIKKRKRKL